MNLNLVKLNYTFTSKPLLIGGKAMEYYGIRQSGADIDLVAPEEDVINLINMFPNRVKNLYEDIGVCPYEFEIWKSIWLYDYDFLRKDAIEGDDHLIISLDRLLYMKALEIKKEKFLKDVQLITKYIEEKQYANFQSMKNHNTDLLKDIKDIGYIEKKGPVK